MNQNKSDSYLLFCIGCVLTSLGVLGLIIAASVGSVGVGFLFWGGLYSGLSLPAQLVLLLARNRYTLLGMGSVMMLIGFLTRKPGDFDDQRPRQNDVPQDYYRPRQGRQNYVHPREVNRQYSPSPAAIANPSRTLIGHSGVMEGKRYRLTGTLVIGRDPSRCQIVFPANAKGVSGKHCTLRFDGRQVTVTDENSSCGTYVNGHLIGRGQTVALHRGNTLSIGSVRQTFTLNS